MIRESRWLLLPAALVLAAVTTPRNARTDSVLIVQVAEAATNGFVADAQVRLPSVGRIARTRWDGEARFDGLPNGKYRVEVRAIGFVPGNADVALTGDTLPLMFRLDRTSTALDTMRVFAERNPRGLREFEERRKTGLGRYFTDSALIENRHKGLQLFLATIPGLRVSGKGVVAREGCHVSFFVDGFEVREMPPGKVTGPLSTVNATLDLDALVLSTFAGMEVYSNINVPVQYKPHGGACAIVLLWTKW